MNKMRFLTPFGFLVVVAIGSAVVMLLWNWLMPTLFGLIAISFWQALGILVFCRLLFGRVSFGKMGFGGMRHEMHGRNPIREKWSRMTSEQKEAFMKKRNLYGRDLIDFFDSQQD